MHLFYDIDIVPLKSANKALITRMQFMYLEELYKVQ